MKGCFYLTIFKFRLENQLSNVETSKEVKINDKKI